jgi:hypothetical protein
MKRFLLASGALLLVAVPLAIAQVLMPPGVNNLGAINQAAFTQNSSSAGFDPQSLTVGAVALATSTAQATFSSGQVLTGQLLVTKTTTIATCSSSTGFTLPAVNHYVAIDVENRSGGSCLIWPSVGAQVETALGTYGSANAPFTMLTNTDVSFKPVDALHWNQ